MTARDLQIRQARIEDVQALSRIEAAVFPGDRLSTRSFRDLIGKKSASLLVACLPTDGRVAGYALILFRRSNSVARLYSVAVSPAAQGRGLAKLLIAAAESQASTRGKVSMRLEVRADNVAAKTLYESLGYRPFGRHLAYYDDNEDALRYEKPLISTAAPGRGL